MLDPFSRGAIVALSTLCVAAVVALAPLRARSSIQDVRLPQPITRVAQRVSGAEETGAIQRDPFVEPEIRDASAATAAAARDVSTGQQPAAAGSSTMAQSATPSRRGTLAALPSNLTNDTIPAIPGDSSDSLANAAHITAIVTGAHAQPYAMVETGDLHEIKSVGDRIAGVAIVSIDLEGIRLQNGRRLSLSGAVRP